MEASTANTNCWANFAVVRREWVKVPPAKLAAITEVTKEALATTRRKTAYLILISRELFQLKYLAGVSKVN